jgi:hypothetical protein
VKTAEIMNQIETEMLDNLLRLVMAGDRAIGSAEWQMNKLQQLGLLRGENLKSIGKHRDALIKSIKEEIEYQAFRKVAMVDEASKAAGVSFAGVMKAGADPVLRETIAKWEAQTLNELGRVSATLLEGANRIYIDTVTKAVVKVQLGVSGRTAIAETAKEWAETGIPALVDSANRTWTTEAYAQTIIRSTSTKAANDSQLARMEELDEDLVEVSSHMGSRPEHADFQGRIYSISGKHPKYDALSVTGYGTAGGIGGVNCRHVLYPYFPGTKKTYSPQPEKRNEESYKRSQKQRYIERSIRSAKRELSAMERIGDDAAIQEARAKVRSRQAAMREFIDSTGRARQYAREQIYEKGE